MEDDARVAIVVKPVDRALDALKLTLIPVLGVALALPAIGALVSAPAPGPMAWILGVIGIPLAAAYLVLVRTRSVGGALDRELMRLRRWIALACNERNSVKERGRVACRLTPEEFHAPLFQYERQEQIVSSLVEACRQKRPGEYWFIEGMSGRGKTRTALCFIQALVRDRELFELGSRCYLYDFNDSADVRHRLPSELSGPRADGSIILVDNFQRVESDVLRDLTRLFMDSSRPPQTQLVVFFARPGEEWNLDPGSEVSLLSAAKEKGKFRRLTGPLSTAVEDGVSGIDEDASERIRELEPDNTASAVQLLLAQVIARNREVPNEVRAALRLLGNDRDGKAQSGLVALLGVLAGLTAHRGKFLRSEFDAALEEVDLTGNDVRGKALAASLDKLHDVGLVSKSNIGASPYVFHEDIARLCIDRLWGTPTFDRAFVAAGRLALRMQMETGDDLVGWLIAVEIGDQDTMKASFERAVAKGANKRMLDCLRRAEKRYPFLPSTRLQLAILLDRTGAFVTSREVLSDSQLAQIDPSDELAVLLAATRVGANHPANHDEADLRFLLSHPGPVIPLIGQYWKSHINTHRGIFEADRMAELAYQALPLVSERDIFWQAHTLGRMHFDSLRAFYLEGRADIDVLASPDRQAVGRYLRKQLPTYTAMQTLYMQAHLVGHVLIPRLALLGEEVTADDAALAGLELNEPVRVSDLLVHLPALYGRAQAEYAQYGDREATYLKADVVNATMIQDDASLHSETTEEALTDYQRFIVSSKFNSINSYPHFFRMRWRILRYFAARFRGGAGEVAEYELEQARMELGSLVALSGEAGNVFGEARARLLTALIRGLGGQVQLKELASLHREMDERGYRFEQALLTRLIDRGEITPLELERIFRFYPFVQQ